MDHQEKKATAEPGERQSPRGPESSAQAAALSRFIEQALTRGRVGTTDGAAPGVPSSPPERHS